MLEPELDPELAQGHLEASAEDQEDQEDGQEGVREAFEGEWKQEEEECGYHQKHPKLDDNQDRTSRRYSAAPSNSPPEARRASSTRSLEYPKSISFCIFSSIDLLRASAASIIGPSGGLGRASVSAPGTLGGTGAGTPRGDPRTGIIGCGGGAETVVEGTLGGGCPRSRGGGTRGSIGGGKRPDPEINNAGFGFAFGFGFGIGIGGPLGAGTDPGRLVGDVPEESLGCCNEASAKAGAAVGADTG
jgi:hypothetical protein